MTMPNTIHIRDLHRSRTRSDKLGVGEVDREVLTDAEMDARLSEYLRKNGPQRTNVLQKALGVYPTNPEVRASLKRIGAVMFLGFRWGFPGQLAKK